MKHFVSILMVALISLPIVAFAGEWYEGGTLNRSTIYAWHQSTFSNQLATSADIVAKAGNVNSMSELRQKASAVQRCINVSTSDPSTHKYSVPEVGALCVIQLGYN